MLPLPAVPKLMSPGRLRAYSMNSCSDLTGNLAVLMTTTWGGCASRATGTKSFWMS
ncbi:Uncharacterised protein [Bordetella pertussis]|nr:Uncharacterised protein [Bordetella pertussis]